jgi:HK97 family phage prohead protease/HK97 family phage major capsid protein
MNNRGSNMEKDQVLKLNFPIEMKEVEGDEDLRITGHASTNDIDRSGDIIVTDAWKKSGALDNYLKNPVILAFHDMSQPIGKTESHEVDEKGLRITARISKAAGSIVQLIKEGILSAFSVGFMIKDADFDPKSGVFAIKELELFEISVVSIPANQNALFSIDKNFSDPEEYLEFKKQFIKESEETLMDKSKEKDQASTIDLATLAKDIATQVKSDLKQEAVEAKAKEEAEKAELDKMEATATTAAERLIKDFKESLNEKDASLAEALKGLHDQVKALADKGEIEEVFDAENKGKMKFARSDDSRWDVLTQNQKDAMIYASKLFNKPITETKLFQDFVKKSNMEHWDPGVTGEWEDEYSTRVQNAMRENLVVEQVFPSIPMSTPTMNMPINPDADFADWVHSAAYRSEQSPANEGGTGSGAGAVSTGEAIDHQLNEQTIIAYKLATREYVGYEEEEDSIVALAPIINDAVSRRMARAADLALLRGGGVLTNTAAYDPILGLEGRGSGTTDVPVAGGAGWAANFTEDAIVDMRRNLSIYGLNPDQLVLLCSHDLYYELMKLTNFKTVDVLGNRATILTGEVGQLFGIRVLVSQTFDNAAITAGTVGTTLGILCRPSNFVVGNLRGIMTEADRDIVNQKRVIVSSRRFGFQEIISGVATVNLEIAS